MAAADTPRAQRRRGEGPVEQEKLAARHDRRRFINCYRLLSVSDQKQTSLTSGMSCRRGAASDGLIDRPLPSPERIFGIIIRMDIVILLGAPGSGKGTIAGKLAGMHWRHKNAAGIALLRATLRSNFRIAA